MSEENVPHTCPVCRGNGLVANGFYTSNNLITWTPSPSTTSASPETCRTCSGSGLVWEQKLNFWWDKK